jgi:hypothetical protein
MVDGENRTQPNTEREFMLTGPAARRPIDERPV